MMSHTRKTTTVSVGTEDQPLTVEVSPGLDVGAILVRATSFEWSHGSHLVKVTGHRVNRATGNLGRLVWGYMPRDQVPGTVLAHLNHTGA